jgi:hypothetical protein
MVLAIIEKYGLVVYCQPVLFRYVYSEIKYINGLTKVMVKHFTQHKPINQIFVFDLLLPIVNEDLHTLFWPLLTKWFLSVGHVRFVFNDGIHWNCNTIQVEG